MKVIPHYCQNCGASNQLGERSCHKCGTRLMLVVFPPSIRHDDGLIPSYYEDHLLERVTLLEIRLSQVTERLALALDLMLRQSKNSQSDHLLLETLIDSLNTLGAVEKDTLTKKWQKRVKNTDKAEKTESNSQNFLREVTEKVDNSKKELFTKLVTDSLNLLAEHEEKQALRTLDRALALSPNNPPLLLFIAETYFQTDKIDTARSFLEKILLIDPENKKAKLLWGIVLANSLELEKAKEILVEISSERTFNYVTNYVLGMIFAFEKNWAMTSKYFKEILANYDLPETHYFVGCAYFQQQKFKLALNHLQKAVEKDTNFADAWFMLAVIYKLTGEESKSFQSIELAWSSKEAGAECLKFMKRGSQIEVESALLFFRLKDLQKHLIMNNSIRFTKLLRGEVSKILNN